MRATLAFTRSGRLALPRIGAGRVAAAPEGHGTEDEQRSDDERQDATGHAVHKQHVCPAPTRSHPRIVRGFWALRARAWGETDRGWIDSFLSAEAQLRATCTRNAAMTHAWNWACVAT